MVERQTDYGRGQIRNSTRQRRREPKPEFGKVFDREAVFKLGPDDLRMFLDLDEAEEDLENQEEESDLDDRDPDDPDSEEDGGELYVNSYLATLGESFHFSGLPVLDLRNKYWLAVSEGSAGKLNCSFEEPGWFHKVEDSVVATYIEGLSLFLHALAQWFEEERREFLEKPIAGNYAVLDEQYPDNSVVVQKDLVTRINARIPEKKRLKAQDFTKLLDNIWMLWPRWNLPLRQLFSKEYRKEWVVQGCLQRYREVGKWLEEAPKDIPKTDLERAKGKDYGNLSLEEMFRVLCAAVGVKTKPTFKLVGERIERVAINGT